MNYLKNAFGLSLFASVVVALAAVAFVFAATVAVAAVGAFLVLFPLVLMTAPVLKRLAKKLENKLKEFAESKAAEAAKANAGIPG